MSISTTIIDTLTADGYEVEAVVLADGAVITAAKDGETWIVRASDDEAAAIELAQQLRFDLEK